MLVSILPIDALQIAAWISAAASLSSLSFHAATTSRPRFTAAFEPFSLLVDFVSAMSASTPSNRAAVSVWVTVSSGSAASAITGTAPSIRSISDSK